MPTTPKVQQPSRGPASVFNGDGPELRKDTLYQQAYEALKQALMGGRMRPGHEVSLRSLAAELGVSPMPVRDALNRLTTQRAMELLPNRTVRVPMMTREKFSELTEVRCYLEARVAKRAAEAMPRGQIAKLSAKNDRMKAAAEKHSIEEFLHYNFEFHFLLYEHSQSEVMLPIIESLWLQAGPFLNEYIRAKGFGVATGHHERVIEGLRQNDVEMVGREIEADIRDASMSVLAYALTRD